MFDMQYFGGVILFLIVALAFSMFRVLREYERGVIFMLGRFYKVKGPGLIIIIPGVQQMVRVDLRIDVLHGQVDHLVRIGDADDTVGAQVTYEQPSEVVWHMRLQDAGLGWAMPA